jgi:organic hydroperoxide reductase OsmC/OhrA
MAEKTAGQEQQFTISIEQLADYHFRTHFEGEPYPDLLTDEPAPLGGNQAPNPSRVLAAAIGTCLSSSLLFCSRKARVSLGPVRTKVHVRLGRNEKGRLRIAGVQVEIDPNLAPEEREKAARCIGLFEDFCVVTESVRKGIDVSVKIQGFD